MSRNDLFAIGEVAKLFHISVSTLHHYERIGLLKPAYVSSDSHYRYYRAEQFEILNTIRYLRALDMPLTKIKDYLENKDIESIRQKLEEQKQAVLQKQQDLKRIEQKINNRLNWLNDAENTPLDVISHVSLPSVRIAWMDNTLQIEGYSDMEEPIRKLDMSDAEAVVFPGKVGLGISKEHLENGEINQYDGIFLLLDNEDIYTGQTITITESEGLRLRFHGMHKDSTTQYEKLLDYIHTHQLIITGFSREITLIDYGVTNDTNAYVTEICIPVTKQ